MPIHYHVQARFQLKKFLAKKNEHYTLSEIYESARALLGEYKRSRESSVEGQSQFLSVLLEKLNHFYDEQVYQHKPWWKKILYFFSWLSEEESSVLSLIKTVKKDKDSISKAEDSIDSFSLKFNLFLLNKKTEELLTSCLDDLGHDVEQQLRYLSHRTLIDVAAVPKELEGNINYIAFKEYLTDLEDFMEKFPGSIQDAEITRQLKNCEEYEKNLILRRIQLANIEKLTKNSTVNSFKDEFLGNQTFTVLESIAQMPIGEQKLFPHGYISKTGGHATVFYVEKIDSEHVVFRFINTGSGASKAESWFTLMKKAFVNLSDSPIKITSPISINELATSNLIPQLLAPQLFPSSDNATAVNAMMEPLINLYQENRLHDDKRAIREQVMGSCSQSCIDAWLSTQLNECNMAQFQAFRLNKCIKKIDALLASSSLSSQQREYCESMRLAAYTSLTEINERLPDLISFLKHMDEENVETLMSVREGNSAYKNRAPKNLTREKIEEYCQQKVSDTRVCAKFSKQEQEKIHNHTLASTVVAKKKKVEANLANIFTFGILGTKVETPLTDEDRAYNKVIKVLLAKNILEIRQQLKNMQNLQSSLSFRGLTPTELARISFLASTKKQQGAILYPQLDIKSEDVAPFARF